MPRLTILSRNGRVLATGLYHLPHVELLEWHDFHDLVPTGSYVTQADLVQTGCAPRPEGCIYLSHRDVVKLPRSDRWQGCCGPDGDKKNVLDPETAEPMAYEFTDCWNAHYIRLQEGDFTLEEESSEDPLCLVGYVRHHGSRLLVGAACGSAEHETLERLLPACQATLQREASYAPTSHGISHLKIGTEAASIFLERLRGQKPRWLFRKY